MEYKMNRGACRQQKVHLGPAERQSAVDAEEFEQSSHTLALALLLFMEGQLEKAVDELRNCITANPGCRPAILFLASIYGNMGLPDKGLRLIDELKDKRSTEFVWFKATLLLHQKINRPDEVVALLRPYVEGHDADENLLSLLLLAYLRKGETERVITISHRLRDLSTSIEPLVVFCQKPPKENHPKDVIQIIWVQIPSV